jgi:hypothetical protein
VECVTAPPVHVPFSPVLERFYLPDSHKIVDRARKMIGLDALSQNSYSRTKV